MAGVTETEICNIALGKLGGAGEELGGNAFISTINGSDKVSSWCKLAFPRVRRRVIKDLATSGSPFRSTIRFKDLGSNLDSDAVPEIGQYLYAFNLPGDCLMVIRQFNEAAMATRASRGTSIAEYHWEEVANRAGSGRILLTDNLSNLAGSSAFIECVVDIDSTAAFTEEMIECIATLLASGVAPVVGADMKASAFMMEQYRKIAIPDAKRANGRGFNNSTKIIPDFSGGRSSGGVGVGSNSGLGTYEGADGLRHEISS